MTEPMEPGQLGLPFDEPDAPVPAQTIATSDHVVAIIERWVALGWVRALDAALVRFLGQEAEAAGQPADPLLLMAVALASHQLGRGHVCLDINQMARAGFDEALSLPPEDETSPERGLLPSELLRGTDAERWRRALDHPLLVASADHEGETETVAPVVRDGLRLYLHRYWRYERAIAEQIRQRLRPLPALEDAGAAPARALGQALGALFPARGEATDGQTDWQKVACANAARHGFGIITGGPGTGKTTTVVKLLAALQAVALNPGLDGAGSGRALRIRLAAPTGKAAARLNESIAGAVASLDLDHLRDGEALRATIPREVTTLHRLLRSVPGSRRFRHHRHNPLVVDTLVIDEASMVDIEMMANVLEALPPGARLILLGDKDQLASVDAGAVLGELCQRAGEGFYSPASLAWLEAVTGERLDRALVRPEATELDQAITLLRKSYRFDEASGIGQLAQAVNRGANGAALAGIFHAGYPDLARVAVPAREPGRAVTRHCLAGGADQFPAGGQGRIAGGEPIPPPVGYRHYLTLMGAGRPAPEAPLAEYDRWAADVLAALRQFQLLCALRRGPFGVEGLNGSIAAALHQEGLIDAVEGWYPGRPVLVTRNDYSLGLMNGDVGINLQLPAWHWERGETRVDPGRLVQRVAFASGDGSGRIHWVLPSRLQAVETVYAMTVHKAQGSEFSHACLVLPDRINPVLTRELVYTGITRARHWFSLLVPDAGVLEQAVDRRVIRTSGLGRSLGIKPAEQPQRG
ncbi:MAG: exodeoxyribonuclease V subunit alpha [Marinobacter sp.]|uniref:exodeoxyribonuclease V subunit alpha n=1 Tax=Marinobacter sp. TaxID=50741 RepID=UPI00299EECBD|nr:exodeoxyribonuclease V subunit alpha [Marinobacter sp.]MDX1634571.1 exodeoxyribonuclease V subunit alpha [Marinobacter sp.]